jgi:nitrate reductase (NAD(P)H)
VAANTEKASSGDLVALNTREKIALRLTERIEVSRNSRIFRFALPTDQHKLGLPCGKHVFLYAKV